MSNKKKVIIIGSGGHAQVLLDTLILLEADILGLTDANQSLHGKSIMGYPILGGDSFILEHSAHDVELVNGVGFIKNPQIKTNIFKVFDKEGYTFRSVIHPFSHVSPHAVLGEGVQVMAGAIIQANAVIGHNCIINTKASIDHDCIIGHHCHIAPGATLSGAVKVGQQTLIGVGATIKQGVIIGEQSIVGAGSTILKDIRESTTVIKNDEVLRLAKN